MKIRAFLLCLAILLAQNSVAKTENSFTISHIEYPGMKSYTDFLQNIYTELGFNVSIISTPSERGLILLNDGLVDADAVRLLHVAQKYQNLIIVQPELNRANLSLLCVKDVPCSRDVLANEHNTVMAIDNAISLLEPGEFKARQANSEAVSNVPQMLRANRHLYALFVLDESMQKHFIEDFQLVALKNMSIYHVIHKKHLALVPQIEAKITAKLPEFRQTKATQPAPYIE